MRLALGCLLLCACRAQEPPPTPARWFIARENVTATDDPAVQLRRGNGVRIVDTRGATGRSSEGRWFPLRAFEVANVALSQPAEPPQHVELPGGVGASDRWIDVDVAHQRVIAYEGTSARKAMKASTGVGEDGAPYSTPRGIFRIYAKLRSTIMSSEPGDPHPYRFEAVPTVQYFNREIALHGAYWHRRFGERLSHGCVNLAPDDAAWLFDFTTPRLATSEREKATDPGKPGTLVRVR